MISGVARFYDHLLRLAFSVHDLIKLTDIPYTYVLQLFYCYDYIQFLFTAKHKCVSTLM